MSGGPRRTRSWTPTTPLASVRNRLVLLFFAITTAAVGFVYLYVVPQLSSSLTAERLERLEQQGTEELDRLRSASARELNQRDLAELVRKSAADVDARVTLIGVRDGAPFAYLPTPSSRARRSTPPTRPRSERSSAARGSLRRRDGARAPYRETAFPWSRRATPGGADW